MYIVANERTYTTTRHADQRIRDYTIHADWIIAALEEPDEQDTDIRNRRSRYKKYIDAAQRWLRVVVDEDQLLIITAFLEDNGAIR